MTTKKIKCSFKQAKSFLEKVNKGDVKKEAINEIIGVLRNTLLTKVYVSDLSKIYEIPTAGDMRSLIKSGGTPKKGKYDPSYLAKKILEGSPPHEQTGLMKMMTSIGSVGTEIRMIIPDYATTRGSKKSSSKVFNFGPIHEARKSVLKSTFVFAWGNVMKKLMEVYERNIR